MYRRKPKRRTSYDHRYNALTASDVQSLEFLQSSLALAIFRQRQASSLLLTSVGMGLHHNEQGQHIFLLTLLNYVRKARVTKILLFVDHLFMRVFPEQVAPRIFRPVRNRSFDSLHAGLCYQYTRFHPNQLRILYDKINLPPLLIICHGRARCTSEEAFLITIVKLATGLPNTILRDFFGIDNHQRVADIYNHTIRLLEEKRQQDCYTAIAFTYGQSILINALVPLKRSWEKKPTEACSLRTFA